MASFGLALEVCPIQFDGLLQPYCNGMQRLLNLEESPSEYFSKPGIALLSRGNGGTFGMHFSHWKANTVNAVNWQTFRFEGATATHLNASLSSSFRLKMPSSNFWRWKVEERWRISIGSSKPLMEIGNPGILVVCHKMTYTVVGLWFPVCRVKYLAQLHDYDKDVWYLPWKLCSWSYWWATCP